MNSHELVAYFIDTARDAGAEPPRRVVGTIAKEIKSLLEQDRVPNWSIKAAIEMVVEKGLDPTLLSSAVFTVQRDPQWKTNRADRELLDTYVREHGWPTGARWRRGQTGGTYVQDTLGHDRPSYDPGWARPTREQIIKALKQRKKEDP